MKEKNAQVSLEAVAGFAVLLFLFSIVLTFNYYRNTLALNLDNDYKAENFCKKVSMQLSDVYNYGKGSKWKGRVDANVFFGTNFLDMNYITGSAFCLHFADLNNPGTRLRDGNFAFENVNGKVRVRNG